MNDADLQDPFIPAGGEILRHKIFHFIRLERMKVKCAVNGDVDCIRSGHENSFYLSVLMIHNVVLAVAETTAFIAVPKFHRRMSDIGDAAG